MENLYFDANQSAAIYTGDDERAVLNLIAGHFIGNHPPLPFQYKIDFDNGILCDQKGHYQFDFGNRFPDTPIGNYCSAVGKLFCFQEHTTTFVISCTGPTYCLVNGELCYQSIPSEEGMHKECEFKVTLKQGCNIFAFLTEKTELGFGFYFGNLAPQWEPYLFQSPLPEREGQLGFVYTPPLPLERAKVSVTNLHEFSWFPILPRYSQEELTNVYPERVFGEHWSGTCFAMGKIRVDNYSVITISAEHETIKSETGRSCAIYIVEVGKKFSSPLVPDAVLDDSVNSVHVEINRGVYVVYIQITRPLGKYRTSLKFSNSTDSIHPVYHIHGYQGGWIYLGPFSKELPEISSLSYLENVYTDGEKKLYWRTGYPHGVLRVCAENELFGRWSYPMGVTLYGLLAAGEYLNRQDYVDYVKQDVAQIIAFHEYALFDKEQFGFPSLNQQICWLSELDDCGSFGSLMLECKKRWDLKGTDFLSGIISQHMKQGQKRQPDGAFIRMDETIWINDLYMSIPFLVRYYCQSKDPWYLDEACRQLLLFRDYFYMTDKHLMAHIYDTKWNKSNRIPWSRGNGWVLFSISELMDVLPRTHKDRDAILQFFQNLTEGILNVQDKSGLWHQLLDDVTTYEETSSTAMFLYAFAKSIRKGYANTRLIPLLQKSVQEAWYGLTHRAIDCRGNLYGVCQAAGSSFSRNYYRTIPWKYNDPHGIGIVLLAGVEKCLLDKS